MSRTQKHGRAYPTLKAWRQAHQMNQREAALKLGFSQTRYSRLERGERTVTGADAAHVMAETNVPLEVLVGISR